MRPLSHYEDMSLLVVPYKTEGFKLYGGAAVTSSTTNYRKKIMEKLNTERGIPPGSCYISSSKGN